jgi:hypothetical protein
MEEHHTFDLLRVQTMQHYEVGDDLRRYLAGEDGPEPVAKAKWLDRLRGLTAAGRRWRVVHAVQTPLSPYMAYACEWGYAPNVTAGQEIRIVDTTHTELSADLQQVGDFYVADREHVLQMQYTPEGRPVGAEPVEDDATAVALRTVAELLWAQGERFTSWWDRHPQYHRDGRRAA